MDLNTAVAMVVADMRSSYPDMPAGEAVAHARHTVSLEGGHGALALDPTGPLGAAYALVLGASADDLDAVL